MEPLPIPSTTAESTAAQKFQSSVYFGSPDSPSQNPFSFANPSVSQPFGGPDHPQWPPRSQVVQDQTHPPMEAPPPLSQPPPPFTHPTREEIQDYSFPQPPGSVASIASTTVPGSVLTSSLKQVQERPTYSHSTNLPPPVHSVATQDEEIANPVFLKTQPYQQRDGSSHSPGDGYRPSSLQSDPSGPQSVFADLLPPPPPPPSQGSYASSNLSTGSNSPHPLLHHSLGHSQSVPDTLQGVNSALTQQLTNSLTTEQIKERFHSNEDVPPESSLQFQSTVHTEAPHQAHVDTNSKPILGAEAVPPQCLTSPGSLGGDGGNSQSTSSTHSVSSLLNGTDDSVTLQSPVKLIPPAELPSTATPNFPPLPPTVTTFQEQSKHARVDRETGERLNTETTLPDMRDYSLTSLSSTNTLVAQEQTNSVHLPQLSNSYSSHVSHSGEPPAANNPSNPTKQDQLGTSRPPELAAPEGSADPVADLQLGQQHPPAVIPSFTGAVQPVQSSLQNNLQNMSTSLAGPLPHRRPPTTADGKDQSVSPPPPPAFPLGSVSLPSYTPSLNSNPLMLQRSAQPSAFSPPPPPPPSVTKTNTEAALSTTAPQVTLPSSSELTIQADHTSLPSQLPVSSSASLPTLTAPAQLSSMAPTSFHADQSEQPGHRDVRPPAGMERNEQQEYYYQKDGNAYDDRRYYNEPESNYYDKRGRYPADYYHQRSDRYDAYYSRGHYSHHDDRYFHPHDDRRIYYPPESTAYDPRYDFRDRRDPYHYHSSYHDQQRDYYGESRDQRPSRQYYDRQDHSRQGYYNDRQRWQEQDYHRQDHWGYSEEYRSGYDVHHQPGGSEQYNTSELRDGSLADTSAIQGRPDNLMDPSQTFYNSPNVAYAHHHGYDSEPPYESTRLEQPTMADEYGGYPYTDDQRGYRQLPVDSAYGYEGETEEPWRPIAEAPPARETPLSFAHPHVPVRFGPGGQLVIGLPIISGTSVEIHSVQSLVPEIASFAQTTSALPGPLVLGHTPKSAVVKYASQQADRCFASKDEQGEALLWKFLVLLCQQNGVVVPSDISELLVQESSLSPQVWSPRGVGVGRSGEEGAVDELRQFLLAGRKKDALDLACRNSLWGHALILASGMDDQSRTYVVNRFTASILSTDPLSTFYTLLLGRTPSVVKPEGLSRAGDWRAHLAMIIANKTSTKDSSSITSLGDSLAAQGELCGAHLCYYLSELSLGCYGDTQCKYSLLGEDHTSISSEFYPEPEKLCKTEVMEYALSLSKPDFSLPSFQTYKLLLTLKLVEAGQLAKALRYCESIGCYTIRSPRSYSATFLNLLVELSCKLHHACCPLGVMETELSPWIVQLEQTVSELMGSDYTPAVQSSRDSPLSSVSQNHIHSQFGSQPPQQFASHFLQVPGQPDGGRQPGSQTPPGFVQLPPTAQATNSEYPHSDTGSQAAPSLQLAGDQQQQSLAHPLSVNQYPPPVQDPQQPTTASNDGGGDAHWGTMTTGHPAQDQYGVTQPQQLSSWGDVQPTTDQNQPLFGVATSVAPGQQEHVTAFSDSQGYGNLHQNLAPQNNGDITAVSSSQPPPPVGNNLQPSLHPSSGYYQPPHSQDIPSFTSSYPDNTNHTESHNKEEEESEDEKEETTKSHKKNQQQKDGGQGLFSYLSTWLPKKKPTAHLPDDRSPKIVWDEEKKKWVDLDADEEEESALAAPPTDAQLRGGPGTQHTAPAHQQPASTQSPETQPPGSNLYSKQNRLQGRRPGARSAYVDVLNPMSGSSKSQPPLSGPSPSLMPPMAAQPFTGNFFVPNLADSDRGGGGGEVPSSGYSNEAAAQSSSVKQEGHHPPSAVQQQPTITQPTATQQQQQQAMNSAVANGGGAGSSTNPPVQPITQPQFFNPSSFASMSVGVQQTERASDTGSEVSTVSDSSREVGRINQPFMATGAGGRLGRMGRRYVQANGGGGQPALPPGGGQYPARHPPY